MPSFPYQARGLMAAGAEADRAKLAPAAKVLPEYLAKRGAHQVMVAIDDQGNIKAPTWVTFEEGIYTIKGDPRIFIVKFGAPGQAVLP